MAAGNYTHSYKGSKRLLFKTIYSKITHYLHACPNWQSTGHGEERCDNLILVLPVLSTSFDLLDHTVLLQRLTHQTGVTGAARHGLHHTRRTRHRQSVLVTAPRGRNPCTTMSHRGLYLAQSCFLSISPLSATSAAAMVWAGISLLMTLNCTVLSSQFSSGCCLSLWVSLSASLGLLFTSGYAHEFPQLQRSKDRDYCGWVSPTAEETGPGYRLRWQRPRFTGSSCQEPGSVAGFKPGHGAQVKRMCSTAYLHIRNISDIRPYLSQTTAERLIYAFVTSPLDMGNALLYGLSDTLLKKSCSWFKPCRACGRRHSKIWSHLSRLEEPAVVASPGAHRLSDSHHPVQVLHGEYPLYLNELFEA